jgi:hypothetical protein
VILLGHRGKRRVAIIVDASMVCCFGTTLTADGFAGATGPLSGRAFGPRCQTLRAFFSFAVENRVHPVGTSEKWNMAQVTKVRLVDDLDGGEADESVSFTIDGNALELDLSNENADKLRDIFAPYIAAARRGDRQPARRQQRMSTASAAPREAAGTIREWAVANGFTVSARGRISAEVMEAYKNRGVGDGAADSPGLPKVADPFKVSFN